MTTTPWRTQLKKARSVLHDFMGRPANLYATISAPEFDSVTVRVHSKIDLSGDLAGTSLAYAERAERRPEVLFWEEQLALLDVPVKLGRTMVVVLSATEAYTISSVQPRDAQTITCEVTRIPETAIAEAALVAPEDT